MRTKEEIQQRIEELNILIEKSELDMESARLDFLYELRNRLHIKLKQELETLKWVLNEQEQ